MDSVIIAVCAVLFFGFGVVVLGAYAVQRWGFPVARTALEAYWSSRWTEIDQRLVALEDDVTRLPRVWEEFARDAKKAQERARWHVRRVKKELEVRGLADDEIETMDGELRAVDGEGGNGQGLLPLHDAMAEVPETPEDPIARALRQKWGTQ